MNEKNRDDLNEKKKNRDDLNEKRRLMEMVEKTTSGTGMVHESFDINQPTSYTRSWFGWANALYTELALQLTPEDVKKSLLQEKSDVLGGGVN